MAVWQPDAVCQTCQTASGTASGRGPSGRRGVWQPDGRLADGPARRRLPDTVLQTLSGVCQMAVWLPDAVWQMPRLPDTVWQTAGHLADAPLPDGHLPDAIRQTDRQRLADAASARCQTASGRCRLPDGCLPDGRLVDAVCQMVVWQTWGLAARWPSARHRLADVASGSQTAVCQTPSCRRCLPDAV